MVRVRVRVRVRVSVRPCSEWRDRHAAPPVQCQTPAEGPGSVAFVSDGCRMGVGWVPDGWG